MNLKRLRVCVVKITQGGGVAAPIAGQIFSEVLPYLEVQNGIQKEEVTVPNLVGKNIKDAKIILEECGLELVINNNDSGNIDDSIVTSQIPECGIRVYKECKVYVDYY